MIGRIVLWISLLELGIGLIELGIGLRINNARRTVLACVSGLVLPIVAFLKKNFLDFLNLSFPSLLTGV